MFCFIIQSYLTRRGLPTMLLRQMKDTQRPARSGGHYDVQLCDGQMKEKKKPTMKHYEERWNWRKRMEKTSLM